MLLVYAVAASMTAPAHAHQMQVAMTTVTFSVRTDSIEVIHRFYTHDTEQAMSQIAGQRVDIMRDLMQDIKTELNTGAEEVPVRIETTDP